MNKSNAHLYLPLVQALAEGKTVQVAHAVLESDWNDLDDLNFGLDPERYRIKPASFPPIPDGMEWHNPDGLTAEQVGDGWRLLTISEVENNLKRPDYRVDFEGWKECWVKGFFGDSKKFTYRTIISTPYPDGSKIVDGKLVKPCAWSLSRHLPGFRALRDGEEWHRQDWTEEMLPEGWRPLLKGERVVDGIKNDEYRLDLIQDKQFDWQATWVRRPLPEDSPGFWRTRRPLPDPVKHLPLGPEDIPPGSVLRWKSWGSGPPLCWVFVLQVTQNDGILIGSTSSEWVNWERLMTDFEILRPGQTDWQPCHKPA